MIPSIGIMIGFYIITRCLSFLSRTSDRTESVLAKVFSIITILVTVGVILSLAAGSATAPHR